MSDTLDRAKENARHARWRRANAEHFRAAQAAQRKRRRLLAAIKRRAFTVTL